MATSPSELSFDKHAFAGRSALPVRVRLNRDGSYDTPGWSFEDYRRGHTFARAPVYRRNPVPEWSLNDKLLRELIVFAFERRVGLLKVQPGTLAERMARCRELVPAKKEALLAVLSNICARHVAAKREGAAREELRRLEAEAETYDSAVLVLDRFPEVLAAVVYRSFRLHENSVEVGEALSIKPPHVRQLLRRLDLTYRRMREQRGVGVTLPSESGTQSGCRNPLPY